MGNSSGGFWQLLLGVLKAIFGSKQSSTSTPTGVSLPPDNNDEPLRIITRRVFLLVYDPFMDSGGTKLSQMMHWNDAFQLANGLCADIQSASNGAARYEIVKSQEMHEFPALSDGFRYTPETYLAVQRGGVAHEPKIVNYQAIMTGFNIPARVAAGEFDEVWLFGFPYAGFYESIMGGAGAFWCNANPLAGTRECNRKFVVMGFNYERGVGEMLEAFGHRSEAVLAHCYNALDYLMWSYNPNRNPATVQGSMNAFQQFLAFDKIAPGKAGLGTIHYAPNSERDYEWNNVRPVPSNCYDWYNFPRFLDDVRPVEASEWGGGDIRAHHLWWLSHLPKAAGRKGGVANNWWQYIMDPNLIGM